MSLGRLPVSNTGSDLTASTSTCTAMLEPRRLVEEILIISRKYRLASSTSSCSFPVSEIMFQFPISSSWPHCCLRAACKSPRAETLCAVPIRPARCVAGATWASSCRLQVGETTANFSKTVVGRVGSDRCAMGLPYFAQFMVISEQFMVIIAQFMVITAQIKPLERPVARFTEQSLRYEGEPPHICVGEALQ